MSLPELHREDFFFVEMIKQADRKRPRPTEPSSATASTSSSTHTSETEDENLEAETSANRSAKDETGIYDPTCKPEPGDAADAERLIFKEISGVKVLCDKLQREGLPSRAYFVKVYTEGGRNLCKIDKDDYFSITYRDINLNSRPKEDFLSPGLFIDNKKIQETKPRRVIEELLLGLGSCVSFVPASEAWDMNASECRKQWDKLNNLKREDHALTGILQSYEFAHLAFAFSKGLTNSAGKAALEGLIRMAIHLTYDDRAGEVACRHIGSCTDATECFPVGDLPSGVFHTGEDSAKHKTLRHQPGKEGGKGMALGHVNSSTFDWVASQQSPDEPIPSASDPGTVCSLSQNTARAGADVVAFSFKEPNWPHILMVGEVKSLAEVGRFYAAALPISAQAQLVRQMLGVLTYQSFVHGVLFFTTSAILVSMKMQWPKEPKEEGKIENKTKKRKVNARIKKNINVTFQRFDFLQTTPEVGGYPGFGATGLRNLFFALVSAIEQTKMTIQGVKHFPRK